MPPYLKTFYRDKIVPELKEKLGHKNIHQVPAIEKIVINSGINADHEKAWVAEIVKEISTIAGQKAVITKSTKNISNFKLKKGMPNGVKVTLRGERMYEFLYRLLTIALPAIRDFRGLPRRLDGQGNYTIGIKDHTIFPEINVDTNRKNIGMDVTIVTTANTDDEGRELLRLLGMPFRKDSSVANKANN